MVVLQTSAGINVTIIRSFAPLGAPGKALVHQCQWTCCAQAVNM